MHAHLLHQLAQAHSDDLTRRAGLRHGALGAAPVRRRRFPRPARHAEARAGRTLRLALRRA